ncbi:hypothetical protein JCM5350_006622 [Sporobolomyces pararoseus]
MPAYSKGEQDPPKREKRSSHGKKSSERPQKPRRHADYTYANVGFAPGGPFGGIDPEIAGLDPQSFSGDSSDFYGGPVAKKSSPERQNSSSSKSWLQSFFGHGSDDSAKNETVKESLSDAEEARKKRTEKSASAQESTPLEHNHRSYGTVEKSLEKRKRVFHPRSRRA